MLEHTELDLFQLLHISLSLSLCVSYPLSVKKPSKSLFHHPATTPTMSLPISSSVQKIASGKVRDLYSHPTSPSSLLFLASDRISAYDVVLSTAIPSKGALLTQMSAFWFSLLPTLCTLPVRHHLLALGVPPYSEFDALPSATQDALHARTMAVRKLSVVPLEAIVRGYLTGSAWAEYTTAQTVHGIPLPAGLQKCQRLPVPLFTPSTKAAPGAHDENIHPSAAARLVGPEVAQKIETAALALYNAASTYAESRGIIIADTKFEFGLDEDGEVVLIDEVLTPDSSRFWDKDAYVVGREQDSFDKQPLRDWLVNEGVKGKQGVEIPAQVVKETAERYKTVFERLTGQKA